MYPLLCAGGYPNPEKDGIMSISSIQAVPVVAGSPFEVQLRDDNVGGDPITNTYGEIMHLKGDGNHTEQMVFDPPLKTRKGIRATILDNATVLIYTR